MDNEKLKKESISGFLWRAFQNVSSQLVSFIIQIVLARILLPEDFGVISLTTVFVQISSVFVQTGLTSSLVQKKEIDEYDKSSMFYLSIALGVILYLIAFFASPLIAHLYDEPLLIDILRVQSISLLFASFSSVSIALITRELRFKKTIFVGLIGYAFQGCVGIWMALNGFGVWSLVIGSVIYHAIYSIGMFIAGKWIPKLKFSFKRIKEMLFFSSSVLFTNLLNTTYNNTRTLVVGAVYSEETLGLYDKGNQFPGSLMTGIDGAMTTVLFSSLSKIQDEDEKFVKFLRRSMKLSLTIVVPMLCGLAAVGYPLISILLTDKWIGSVPFLMIYCAICLTWPLSAKTHALNAKGKSGLTFLVNTINMAINIALMLVSTKYGIINFALATLLGTYIGTVLTSIVVSKTINYSLKDQLRDELPIYITGLLMFACIYGLSMLSNINLYVKLALLVVDGITIYIGLSVLFGLEGFNYIVQSIKKLISKSKDNIIRK